MGPTYFLLFSASPPLLVQCLPPSILHALPAPHLPEIVANRRFNTAAKPSLSPEICLCRFDIAAKARPPRPPPLSATCRCRFDTTAKPPPPAGDLSLAFDITAKTPKAEEIVKVAPLSVFRQPEVRRIPRWAAAMARQEGGEGFPRGLNPKEVELLHEGLQDLRLLHSCR